MEPVRLVVINGSPRKRGHTSVLAQRAAEAAAQSGAGVDVISLSGLNIAPCSGCSDSSGKFRCRYGCNIQDDMQRVYPVLERSDAILVATPVYYGNISGQLKCLLDRTNALKFRRYRLADKVGGALAVAAHQHGGVEVACDAVHRYFLIHGMIVVNDGAPPEELVREFGSVQGPRSESSVVWDMTHYAGGFADPHGDITADPVAMMTSWALGKRLVQVAEWIRVGREQRGGGNYGYDYLGT